MIDLMQKRIFIVEDNLQNRIIFQMALVRYGALCEFERWGRDTLTHLNNMPLVDLIILDLMLPGGFSGFEIYDQIRAVPRYGAVPIVAVSAMERSIAVPQAREKGFAGFIAKPIDARLFPEQLARIIDGETIWHNA